MTRSAAPDPPTQLRALISWQLSKASTLATRLTAQWMPVTARADSALLAALDEYGPLSQAELGRRLGLDRNDINGIVNRLQAGRHVEREADAHDRRRNVIRITEAGQTHRADLFARAGRVQNDLLAALEPAERRQLHALLEKLLTAHASQPA